MLLVGLFQLENLVEAFSISSAVTVDGFIDVLRFFVWLVQICCFVESFLYLKQRFPELLDIFFCWWIAYFNSISTKFVK